LTTGSIWRRRDELINKAAVCWLNGNSHDMESYHLSEALRSQLNLGHDDFQVVKHFPEQYLVIFSNPAIRRHLVNLGVLSDRAGTSTSPSGASAATPTSLGLVLRSL